MKRLIGTLLIVFWAWPSTAALDSERRRGSAMLMSLPGRPWLTHPDGGFSHNDRLSLMFYASNVSEIPPLYYYYTQGGSQ